MPSLVAFFHIMFFRLLALSAIFCGPSIAAPPPTTLPGKTSECAARLTPANPPNEGILFVDHSAKRRSGHLGHALVQYEPGKLLAFYPNCSGDNGGHSGIGWMEYKRSVDGGKSWSDAQVLSFSKKLHEKKMGRSAMAEKAVVTDKGEIVLFYLICDVAENALWQPYWVPLISKSTDAGQTWSEPHGLIQRAAFTAPSITTTRSSGCTSGKPFLCWESWLTIKWTAAAARWSRFW